MNFFVKFKLGGRVGVGIAVWEMGGGDSCYTAAGSPKTSTITSPTTSETSYWYNLPLTMLLSQALHPTMTLTGKGSKNSPL